ALADRDRIVWKIGNTLQDGLEFLIHLGDALFELFNDGLLPRHLLAQSCEFLQLFGGQRPFLLRLLQSTDLWRKFVAALLGRFQRRDVGPSFRIDRSEIAK